jgi:hypothetical protein
MEMYKEGFWNYCKDNHPQIIFDFAKEMKKGMKEFERFVDELEKKEELSFNI